MYIFHSIIFYLLFILTIPLIAQEDEEVPLPPKRAAQSKIGGAGGFTQNILFLNINPINDILRQSNAATFGDNRMLMLGGQGYGYIMVMPNLRIGGAGASGTMASKSVSTNSNISREVELSVGYGGVTIEYAISLLPRLDISPGILLGGGGMNFKIRRDQGNAKIWDNIWEDYKERNNINEYTTNLSGSFFSYQPSLNLEYAILRWLGVRIGVSYSGMEMLEWKHDEKDDLIGVPDNINGRGVMLNGGIFLGTFMY